MEGSYQEVVRLANGATIRARVARDRSYRLGLYQRGAPLVEYWSEGAIHRRRAGERTSVYEFRSIEQLRYDFERDAEDALDRD